MNLILSCLIIINTAFQPVTIYKIVFKHMKRNFLLKTKNEECFNNQMLF